VSRQAFIVLAALALTRGVAFGEDLDPPDAEPDKSEPEWNEFEGRYFSLRAGGGVLLDYVAYDQTSDSATLMSLPDTAGIRDLRFLVSGRTPLKRVTYTSGYMYDAGNDEWVFRQTGLKVQIPELGGFLFLGRTKEGFSTNKFTVGYYGVFNERSAANDAFIPILADGIRWTAATFDGQLVYNVGAFVDWRSKHQTFSRNDWQVVGRAVWLPLGTADSDSLVHIAGELRYAGADDGMLQFRSKPESFLAKSYAVDTGKFEASTAATLGAEAYYRPGSLLVGLEYYFTGVSSDPAHDPMFHGGDISVAYLLTGEVHPYNAQGAFFGAVEPKHAFPTGGAGAWELALRVSYVDLDGGLIRGGRFARVTPGLNWYVSSVLRFEAFYGYGVVDRMDMSGGTHFFQTRLQMSI
jgi:phosphate-selective porin OprO and OprP